MEIVSSAKKHVVKREECFKVGKHNYINGRSIFEHNNPQKPSKSYRGICWYCVRVSKELPGVPGYKEVVDFKEHIGIWKNREGMLALPTTTGTIHYSKKGAHVVPAHPNIVV